MEKVLSIVLQARDDATEKIEKMGDSLQKAADNGEKMAEKMRQAGAIMGGFAAAGLGTMSIWAKAAMDAEVETAKYENTLKNAANLMKTTTQVIKGNEEAIKSQEEALKSQIDTKEMQIKQLRLADGDHKDEIRNIEREILALDEQSRAIKNSVVVKDSVIEVANRAAMSYEKLKGEIKKVADAYVNLAFDDEETSTVMAKNLMVTKDLSQSKKLLAIEADLARYASIDLTSAQKAMATAIQTGNIKALRDLNVEIKEGASQQEIMEEVYKRVNGQAEAYTKTHEGMLKVLKTVSDNMQEALGERVLKAAEPLFKMLTDLAIKIKELPESTLDLIAKIVVLGTTFASVAAPLLLFAGNWKSIQLFLATAGTAMIEILPILALVVGAAYLLYQAWTSNFGGIQEKTKAVLDAIVPYIQNVVIPAVAGFIDKLIEVGSYVAKELAPIFNFFVPVIVELVKVLAAQMGPILSFVIEQFKYLWKQITELWNLISPFVIPVLKVLAVVLGVAIFGAIGAVIGILAGLTAAFGGVIWFIAEVVKSFRDWTDGAIKGVKAVISFVEKLIENIKWVFNNIGTIGDNITHALGNIGIRAYADGGYVPSTGPAIVHQGEYVLSNAMLSGRQSIDSRILAALGNGGGRNVTINLGGVSVNNKSDADYLVAQLSYQMRASGGM